MKGSVTAKCFTAIAWRDQEAGGTVCTPDVAVAKSPSTEHLKDQTGHSLKRPAIPASLHTVSCHLLWGRGQFTP